MRYIVVFEAAQNMGDGIDFPNIGKKLIAEPFAFRSTTHQPSDIDKGETCGNDLRRFCDVGDCIEACVGNRDVTNIGFDGAERIIRRLRRGGLRQRVEERRLADIRQTDNAALKPHPDLRPFSLPSSFPACRKHRLVSAVWSAERRGS